MKNTSPLLFLKVFIIIAAFLGAAQFIPEDLFNYWDFRNNLWGPVHLLTSGHSPYAIKQLFPDANAVWMPQIIGLLFPIGWVSLSTAARLWLLFTLAAVGLLIYLYSSASRPAPWKFALILLAVFFFPPMIIHIHLGQISIVIVLCLILATFRWDTSLWKGLLCVIALVKPQLCLLVVPGIFIRTYQDQGKAGFMRLCASAAAWAVGLTVPLFILYPSWFADFTAALSGNASWAQPSLLYFLKSRLGQPGLIVWLVAALAVFIVNLRMWSKFHPRQATPWSLALTCLVNPYIWSWDFVLLLPCFLYLLRQPGHWAASAEVVTGFLAGALLMWKLRWGTTVSDEVFIWVPAYMIAVYLLHPFINRVLAHTKQSTARLIPQ